MKKIIGTILCFGLLLLLGCAISTTMPPEPTVTSTIVPLEPTVTPTTVPPEPTATEVPLLAVLATEILSSEQIGYELTGEALIVTLEISNQMPETFIFSMLTKQPYIQSLDNQFAAIAILVNPLYLYGIPGGPVGGAGKYGTEVHLEKGMLPEVDGISLEITDSIWASWVAVDNPLEEEGGPGDHFLVPVDGFKLSMETGKHYELKLLIDLQKSTSFLEHLYIPYYWHPEDEEPAMLEETLPITLEE